MSAIILPSATFKTDQNRKPSVPAFLYRFHNAPGDGLSVLDAFGNGPTLESAGVEGTMWTPRGSYNPAAGNTTQYWRANGADPLKDYPRDVLPVVTPGAGFCVFFRYTTGASNPPADRAIFGWGRSASSGNYAIMSLHESTSGALAYWQKGVGADSAATNGLGSLDRSTTHQLLIHIEVVDATTLRYTSFIDGIAIQEREQGWNKTTGGSTNNNTAPLITYFTAQGSGLCIGARANTATLTTYNSVLSGTDGNSINNVGAINLGAPSMATALDLALEMTAYPRHIGEILAGL